MLDNQRMQRDARGEGMVRRHPAPNGCLAGLPGGSARCDASKRRRMLLCWFRRCRLGPQERRRIAACLVVTSLRRDFACCAYRMRKTEHFP